MVDISSKLDSILDGIDEYYTMKLGMNGDVITPKEAKQSILTYISDHYVKIEDVEKIIGKNEVTVVDNGHECNDPLCDYCYQSIRDELRAEQCQRLNELRGKK